jgi:hypothetical protein
LLGAAILAASYWVSFRGRLLPGWPVVCGGIVAVAAGGFIPWSQRGPEADTAPINEPLPEFDPDPSVASSTRNTAEAPGVRPDGQPVLLTRPVMQIGEAITLITADGSVRLDAGLSIELQPLLTFQSRSPDRCWTVLAPRGRRIEPRRRLVGVRAAEHEAQIRYAGAADYLLRVQSPQKLPGSGNESSQSEYEVASIDVWTRLPQPVYSHLNTFSELTVRGHKRLMLSFSPCPDRPVEVQPFDYPAGRPARFSYLDAGGTFRVVEASSGEKGPFKELVAGRLSRTDSLSITLYDGAAARCRITFLDWAAQASTSLSPTAGWRVPMNAIEFSRFGNEPHSPAGIWVTLAGTSVGRGWDSVGHAAGTYRNRIRIETIE